MTDDDGDRLRHRRGVVPTVPGSLLSRLRAWRQELRRPLSAEEIAWLALWTETTKGNWMVVGKLRPRNGAEMTVSVRLVAGLSAPGQSGGRARPRAWLCCFVPADSTQSDRATRDRELDCVAAAMLFGRELIAANDMVLEAQPAALAVAAKAASLFQRQPTQATARCSVLTLPAEVRQEQERGIIL